jgi:hypothetical protein
MKELTREEAVELAGLVDDCMREDPRSMYYREGRIWFHEFVNFIYKEGFKIIKGEGK